MVPQKTSVILPDLPPELWLKIHRFATHVPGLLDPGLALDFSSASRRARWRHLKVSLITKRYLVRVCKQWKSLTSPLLYESIYIGRGRALLSISNTLKLSKANQYRDGADCELGWWTKRIDVMMRDHLGTHAQDRDVSKELLHLAEIFRHLPNLNIVNFGITATLYDSEDLPETVLQSIADTSGSCLKAIVWHGDTPAPHEREMQRFLLKTPNIETIQCPTTLFPTHSDVVDRISELPALKHLSIIVDGDLVPPPPEHLPCLSLSRLCMVSLGNAGILPQSALLEKYGANLTVFQLGGQVSYELLPNLRLIAKTCPNLYRLDISFSDEIRDVIDWSALPATIKILGLQFDRGRLPRKVYQELLGGLKGIPSGSNLKIIQFIDRMNVKDLFERHRRVIYKHSPRLAQVGLQLHDHEGCLMQ